MKIKIQLWKNVNWPYLKAEFEMSGIKYQLLSWNENVEDLSELKLKAKDDRWGEEMDVQLIQDNNNWSGEVIIDGFKYTIYVSGGANKFYNLYLFSPNEEETTKDYFYNKLKQALNDNVQNVRVYHYTHLFNALQIVKSGEIASRKNLKEQNAPFYDSAGDVISNNRKAEPFARFYFRTRTKTQFMNEYLGHDSELTIERVKKQYFNQAKKLGFPKCPFPVIFELSLKQILDLNDTQCFYSTGNLQSKDALIYSVLSPSHLSTKDLFDDDETFRTKAVQYAREQEKDGCGFKDCYKEQMKEYERVSQQEFLVKEKLPIADKDYRILCPSEGIQQLLTSYIDDDSIKDKVIVAQNYFYNENRQIKVQFEDAKITFRSDYNTAPDSPYYGTSYFVFKGDIKLINNYQCIREVQGGKAVYPSITIKYTKNDSCSLFFIDEFARTRKWLIFTRGERQNGDSVSELFVKHGEFEEYKVFIDNFLEEINSIAICLSKCLFNSWMVNSYHGIGHTTRVVFFTYLILKISKITDKDLRSACYYAAILHDIGKSRDIEDSEHGEKSCDIYRERVKNKNKKYRISALPENLVQPVLDAVKYHSYDDNKVPEDKKTLIWKVLKDADALDRARLPREASCDRQYLRMEVFTSRSPESELLLKFATHVTLWTASLAYDDPYNDLINKLKLFV